MSFTTDHFALILQPKKPLKAQRRKIKSRVCRIQKLQRRNLALDRHVFDALCLVTDPSTAAELLLTAIFEKLNEHCPMRSVKMSSKDPPYLSPLQTNLLQKKQKQKFARGTQKLKETEKKIQGTIIANIKTAKKQTWICFLMEDNHLHAPEKEKMLNSAGF